MLTYSLQDTGNMPLYEYLYKRIRDDILNGKILPGEKLPSKRTFAKHLGISTITVENAYAQLATEGFIYSIPKKGFYVSDMKNFALYNQRAADLLGEDAHTLGEKDMSLTHGKKGEEVFNIHPRHYHYDFASNQTNKDSFPFRRWAKITREVLSDDQEELMINPISGGMRELRESIAEYLNGFRGLDVSPEQIVVGAGTEYLYGLLIHLLGFDKVYAIENPGYRKIHDIYDAYHVRQVLIPLDKKGIDMKRLSQSEADIVHVTPSHHFPTGITMPVSRRYELLNWAGDRKGRYIIEDDYDSEFRMNVRPIPSLCSIDQMERTIYINTFTKTLSSTIRVSYMVLPRHLIRDFYQRLSFFSCTVSTFEQLTLARFIGLCYFEKHLNRMRNAYRRKRNLVLDTIRKSPIAAVSSISEQDSGLHFLLHLDLSCSDETFVRMAHKAGIRINSLESYYIEPHAPSKEELHEFVINYSSMKDEKIGPAVDALYHLVCQAYSGDSEDIPNVV